MHEQILGEWQQWWQSSEKGAVTRKFFPTTQERIGNVKLDHYTDQFMTGHGDFRAKLRSFTLSKTNLCDCDQIDISEHELFHCPIYEKER